MADLCASNRYPIRGNSTDTERWLGTEQETAHGSGIQSFNLHRDKVISLADLVLFFQELVNYQPDKLLRVKGLVAVAGKAATPAVVHGIRDKVYPLV